MTAQVPQVDRLIEKSSTLVEEIEDAFKELESNHRMPRLRDARDEMVKALIEYRDSVLKDIVANAISVNSENSNKIGRSTEWGSKKPWKKSVPSVGESTRFSTVPEQEDGMEQKFEDDDESIEPERSAPPSMEKPKKKKVVRRVLRKIPTQQDQGASQDLEIVTSSGQVLEQQAVSDLRAVLYYVLDKGGKGIEPIRDSVSLSIEESRASSGVVGTIVDTATRDRFLTGKSATASLGLDDGIECGQCTLPVLLRKLIE
jgi:hypothetical protein